MASSPGKFVLLVVQKHKTKNKNKTQAKPGTLQSQLLHGKSPGKLFFCHGFCHLFNFLVCGLRLGQMKISYWDSPARAAHSMFSLF